MQAWARTVARYRYLVLAGWAVVAGLGFTASNWLPSLLTTSLGVPGTGSAHADAILSKAFRENVEGTFTVVVPEPRRPGGNGPQASGTGAQSARPAPEALHKALGALAEQLPGGGVSEVEHAQGFSYANVSSSLGLDAAASRTPRMREHLKALGGLLTGPPAIQYDVSRTLSSDLRRGEVIAIAVAVVVLIASLGFSLAVLLPFVIALAATSCTLGAVFLLAHVLLMVLYIPDLVQLIGLGLAVDYGLLVVHRYREELAARAERPDASGEALAATLGTAGRTVAASGAAVAAGLMVLAAVPVPFVRSLGVAGCLVPLFSVAAALSLLPACLSILGVRLVTRPARLGSRGWEAFATLVTRRPLAPAVAALGLLAVAAVPVAWLALTPASTAAIPAGMPSAEGLALLRSGAGPGVITPLEIVVDGAGPGSALAEPVGEAVTRLADALVAQPDVFVVAIGDRGEYVAANGRYRRVVVVARASFGSAQTQALVRRIRGGLVQAAHFPVATRVYVGGAPAQGVDFLDRTYGPLPWLVLGAFVIAYVVLARVWRSAVLPALTLALDCASIAAAYGVMVAVFRFGLGQQLYGAYRVGQIEGWVPVFILAMLFGLSMDYQVFLVARMREQVDAGVAPRAAVADGLARTGKVVSAAAAVMVGALAGLASSRIAGMQELGTGLAAGVALDATLVRGVLLPAMMSWLGGHSWCFPGPLAVVLGCPACAPSTESPSLTAAPGRPGLQ